MNSYEYWLLELKKAKNVLDKTFDSSFKDFPISQEVAKAAQRKIEITEEILEEAICVLDDEQYTETTSWGYESELKVLDEKLKFYDELTFLPSPADTLKYFTKKPGPKV